ncbi:glycine betaine ABC transporter substrate-binding protein, partial [Corynebacterium heidelbergense]
MDRQADPHANPEPTGHAAAPRDHGSNLAAATGRSGTGDLPHRSGSEPYFDEDFASLYSQAIADEGVETKINGGIGARDVYLSALEKGDIDIVPEYTG